MHLLLLNDSCSRRRANTRASRRPPDAGARFTPIAWRVKQLRLSEGLGHSGQTAKSRGQPRNLVAKALGYGGPDDQRALTCRCPLQSLKRDVCWRASHTVSGGCIARPRRRGPLRTRRRQSPRVLLPGSVAGSIQSWRRVSRRLVPATIGRSLPEAHRLDCVASRGVQTGRRGRGHRRWCVDPRALRRALRTSSTAPSGLGFRQLPRDSFAGLRRRTTRWPDPRRYRPDVVHESLHRNVAVRDPDRRLSVRDCQARSAARHAV